MRIKSEKFCKSERSVWWKAYFFLIVPMSALGMLSFWVDPAVGIAEYVNSILWLILTVGLYCFVFTKPIGCPKIWFWNFVIYLGYSITYPFITTIDLRANMSEFEFYTSLFIGLFLSLPGFYAIYSISQANNKIWRKGQ